ncbi:MAG: tetratricopeptide repeat protein, partial [Chloroflexota bacterium]
MSNHKRQILQQALMLFIMALSACSNISAIPTIQAIVETATAIPSPTISPTPIDSPTPKPEVRIKDGDQALFFGDFETAISSYRAVQEQSSNPKQQAAAALGLSQAYYKVDNLPLALATLRNLIQQYPNDINAIRANFLLGEIYTQLQRYDEALQSYSAYIIQRPGIIDAYVYELIGDIHFDQGNYANAIHTYQSAYLAPQLGSSEKLAVKIARAYDESTENNIALSLYQDIYFNTTNEYTKAQMDLLMGRIYYANEQFDLAYERFQDAVDNFPHTYDSYTALVTLVNDGQEVNELQRGMVNYFVGQYSLAIEALNRYLKEEQADIPSALYYKALSTRSLGATNYPFGSDERYKANQQSGTPEDIKAITLWEQIIQEYPGSAFFIDSWEDIAYTQSLYMGKPELAAHTELRFVASVPEAPQASAFIYSAGRDYERAGMLQEAAQTWSRLANEYPSSSETFQGLFFSGAIYYRLQDHENALLTFERSLVLSTDPFEVSASYLWIGKIHNESGDLSSTRDAWKQAAISDPNGYYSLRAEELLSGKASFSEPEVLDFSIDIPSEKLAAESWLRTTFNLAAETNLESPGMLAADERFIRGWEFWSLGHYPEGRNEFEDLRLEKISDPTDTFRLIQAFVDMGLYRSAIQASRSILNLAGLDSANTLDIPIYFNHVIYGPYYLHWIQEVGAKYDFSVLFLLSLIHQESLFEGFVESYAGARGIMQIMPATGAQIAGEIAWP